MGATTNGRELEAAVAGFLTAQGYSTRQNDVLTGRSGVSQEVDVLAQKCDGLVTFRVTVERKNWNGQDKAVVTKAAHFAGDLGLSKAIVACVGGCEPGARQTAAELGVEVWGPEEIAEHLRSTSLRDDATGTTEALGYAASDPPTAALGLIAKEARGTLGLGHENVVAQCSWMPS